MTINHINNILQILLHVYTKLKDAMPPAGWFLQIHSYLLIPPPKQSLYTHAMMGIDEHKYKITHEQINTGAWSQWKDAHTSQTIPTLKQPALFVITSSWETKTATRKIINLVQKKKKKSVFLCVCQAVSQTAYCCQMNGSPIHLWMAWGSKESEKHCNDLAEKRGQWGRLCSLPPHPFHKTGALTWISASLSLSSSTSRMMSLISS